MNYNDRSKIKFYLCFTLAFLFLMSFTLALDCQYTSEEKYQEFGTWLYDSEGNYFGEPLVLKEFKDEYMGGFGCSPAPSFKIYNPYNFPVSLNIKYTLFHSRVNNFYPESKSEMAVDVDIEPYSEKKIDSTCLDIGTNQILEESISYTISGKEELILKKGNRELEKEVCKICPSGKQCLSDNSPCSFDNECGSGICNIGGFCGDEKIISCEPYGKLNCKNQKCLMPLTKEDGESYMCDWECKSGRFEEGKCLKTFEQLKKEKDQRMIQFVIFSVIIFIILLIAYWKFKKKGADVEEKRKNLALKERLNEEGKAKNLKEEILILKEEKEKIKEEKEKIKEEKEKIKEEGNEEIKKIKEEINNARGNAKVILKDQLKKREERYKDKIKSFDIKDQFILKEERRIKIKEEELKRRGVIADGVKDNIEKEIEAALIKYGRLYGKEKIKYDYNTGYIKFVSNGEDIHRWIYKKGAKLRLDEEVHHIDNDKLNNDLWNLLALKKVDHKMLSHGKIDFQNWESGIHQIKEQLRWDDSDFPEHIQKEIKKRNEQKKL